MDAAPPASDSADAARGRIRSRLYPSGWSPGMRDEAGRFLHDFSYAGYRNGERPLPTLTGPLFDVIRFGASPSTTADQTAAFQAALDAAAGELRAIDELLAARIGDAGALPNLAPLAAMIARMRAISARSRAASLSSITSI